MEPKQQKFSIGYVIAAVLALMLIQSVFFAPHAENLSYSEFKVLAKKGKVANLVLDGLATFEAPRQALFLNVPSLAQREYSEETARRIDAEIEQLLKTAHGRVRETLTARREVLTSLAKLLIEKEVVSKADLDALLASAAASPLSAA